MSSPQGHTAKPQTEEVHIHTPHAQVCLSCAGTLYEFLSLVELELTDRTGLQ